MNIGKIIFRIAIGLLAFWLISPIVFDLMGLEFKNQTLGDSYEQIRGFGILICILLTLFGTIKKTDEIKEIIFKVFMTFSTVIVVFIFMAMMAFSDMCVTTYGDVLYISKTNKKVKIVETSFGCGATDSSSSTRSVTKKRDILHYFILVKRVDLYKIDKNEWIEIEE